jgi:hypothetical protein
MGQRCAVIICALILVLGLSAQAEDTVLASLDQWRSAIESGDITKLSALYSTQPPVVVKSAQGDNSDLGSELKFWSDLHNSGIRNLQTEVRKNQEQGGVRLITLQASFVTNTAKGPRTRYVHYQQAWQRLGEKWLIVGVAHSDIIKIRQPRALNPKLYDTEANAADEIKRELADAAKTNRRLILVFGGNWCYDCHVLDGAFHEPDVAPIVQKNFIIVHVDIGNDGNKNHDLAKKYNTPLDKGVPVLAVLDSDGKLLFSQQNGEFESARSMDPDDLIAFLNKWKPRP